MEEHGHVWKEIDVRPQWINGRKVFRGKFRCERCNTARKQYSAGDWRTCDDILVQQVTDKLIGSTEQVRIYLRVIDNP